MSPSRIDELRRRVQNDPASIAFAQLAEEYRRSGQTDEAVRICREGLVRHPGYLSARVTLGRALLDLGQTAEARGEFEFVVAEAPENLAAVRGLAEIFHRDGNTAEALSYYQRALALARHDPEIEEIVQQLSRQIGLANAGPPGGLSFEEAHQELLTAAERVPLAPPSAPSTRNAAEGSTAPFDFDRLVAALGSPAAPPQLEAAVEGRAVPALDLPDAIDLGLNPFAALEAELRAHELPASAAAAGEPQMAVRPEPEPAWAPAFADTPPAEVPGVEALLGDSDGYHDDLATVSVVVIEPVAESNAELAVRPEPAPVRDVVAPPVAATEGPLVPTEDVLGDLETWLNTLHDRSTE